MDEVKRPFGASVRAWRHRLGISQEELAARAGLPARIAGRRPRLADLRHSFAVQTLLDWHEADLDLGAGLPILSAYLGHVSPASTYWYLSASPQLLAAAAARLERGTGGLR